MTKSTTDIPILDDDAVAKIEALSAKVPDGPWLVDKDDAEDVPDHRRSGLALVDTGRSADWWIARLCEWHVARFIAESKTNVDALCQTVRVLRAEIDATWLAIERGWEIEPRSYFEREAPQNGFESPLAQAVHHMWKRKIKDDADESAATSMRSACVEKVREFANEFYPHEQEIHEALNEAADYLKELQDQEAKQS